VHSPFSLKGERTNPMSGEENTMIKSKALNVEK
jgi:hypothetical protein